MFQISHLAAGTYSVSIDAAGFTPALEGGIQVVTDKVTRDQIKLGISVNQEIDVLAVDEGAAGAPRNSVALAADGR